MMFVHWKANKRSIYLSIYNAANVGPGIRTPIVIQGLHYVPVLQLLGDLVVVRPDPGLPQRHGHLRPAGDYPRGLLPLYLPLGRDDKLGYGAAVLAVVVLLQPEGAVPFERVLSDDKLWPGPGLASKVGRRFKLSLGRQFQEASPQSSSQGLWDGRFRECLKCEFLCD